MENKDVYIIRAFFNLQDFKRSGQGKMEEMNMAGGLGRFLEIAGRTLLILKESFFCMEEVGKRNDENEEKEDAQVENLFLSVEHFILY